MKTKKVVLFDIPVDAITMTQTLELIKQAIEEKRQIHHTVVNAGKIVMMQSDEKLFKSVVSSDIINADGQIVVWVARLLGKGLPERVTGIDLMEKLMLEAHKNHYKVFFLGAREEIVKKLVEIYSKRYSPSIIAGYRNGYFSKEEEPKVAYQIQQSGAQILFVAITSPKKENFLYENKELLNSVNFVMGVGGSFDVVTGFTKRAPEWMQKLGFEWFYRLIQEPRRMWHRYTVGNFKFLLLTIHELQKHRKT